MPVLHREAYGAAVAYPTNVVVQVLLPSQQLQAQVEANDVCDLVGVPLLLVDGKAARSPVPVKPEQRGQVLDAA